MFATASPALEKASSSNKRSELRNTAVILCARPWKCSCDLCVVVMSTSSERCLNTVEELFGRVVLGCCNLQPIRGNVSEHHEAVCQLVRISRWIVGKFCMCFFVANHLGIFFAVDDLDVFGG